MENAKQNSIRLSCWKFNTGERTQEVEDKGVEQGNSVASFSEVNFMI